MDLPLESLLAALFVQEFLRGLGWMFIPCVRLSDGSALQPFSLIWLGRSSLAGLEGPEGSLLGVFTMDQDWGV